MASPQNQQSAGGEWVELNVLRGLAVVCMVIHHCWAYTELALEPLAEVVVHHGGAAPVLFFWATGLGYGLRGPRRGPIAPGSLKKIGLLLLADALFTFEAGLLHGLNFLGFIGLSALALELLSRLRRPLAWALFGAGAVVFLRYGVGTGPVLERTGLDTPLLRYALGSWAIEGYAYPLLPWLFYPLVGYVLGDRARRLPVGQQWELEPRTAAALTIVGEGAALAAVRRGLSFCRWGFVTHAYFAFSIGAMGLAFFLARLLSRVPWLASVVAMRGVSSLAVVPIHYGLIELLAAWMGAPQTPLQLALFTLVVMASSFALAPRFECAAQQLKQRFFVARGALPLLAVPLLCAAALLFGEPSPEGQRVAIMVFGQLAVCLLMVVPLRRPGVRPNLAAGVPAPSA